MPSTATEHALASAEKGKAYAGGHVELTKVTSGALRLPFCSFVSTDSNIKAKSKGTFEVCISYWTNEVEVPKGAAIIAVPKGAPIVTVGSK